MRSTRRGNTVRRAVGGRRQGAATALAFVGDPHVGKVVVEI